MVIRLSVVPELNGEPQNAVHINNVLSIKIFSVTGQWQNCLIVRFKTNLHGLNENSTVKTHQRFSCTMDSGCHIA